MNKLFQITVVGMALLAGTAHADTLLLTNGNEIAGIVLSETPEKVELQFAHAGSITFGRDEIKEIRYSDSAGRDSLREGWAAKQEDFLAELKAEEAFAKAQREKGLILDGGEWITKDEYSARTERQKAFAETVKADAVVASAKQETKAPEVIVVSEPVGVPIIVSSLRRGDHRRERRRARTPRVRDWKNDEPGARDWRGELPTPSIHQRAMTAHYNHLHFH